MARRFEGKVAWITGAGSGIGRALALELAREGAAVVLSGRRVDRLTDVAAEIESSGGRAFALPCDVREEEAVRRAVTEVISRFGQLDIAVANAGFALSGRVEALSAEDWRRQLDTNVVGVAVTARHALPELRKTAGRVVLVGSVSAMLVGGGLGAYSASKAALRALGQALSIECYGTGVTCTTIHPGFVQSEIAQVDNEGRFDPLREDRRPKKLMWRADRAARVMTRAIHRRDRETVFTGHGKLGAFVGRHMPGLVYFAVRKRRRSKQSPQR